MNRTGMVTCLAPLFAAVFLLTSGGCSLMQKPTARIAGAKLQNVGLAEATMLFDVEVENPYAVSLPLGNLDYELKSDGQRFLAGEADVQGEVPAKSSKTLGVPVRISYVELVRVVQGARPGATIPYTADLGLSVEVPALGTMRLPMTREGQLEIPTAPGLLESLKGLRR